MGKVDYIVVVYFDILTFQNAFLYDAPHCRLRRESGRFRPGNAAKVPENKLEMRDCRPRTLTVFE